MKRIFLLSPYLRGYGGHFYNQIQGFRYEAQKLGIKTVSLIHKMANEDVIKDLDGKPVFDRKAYGVPFYFNDESRDRESLGASSNIFARQCAEYLDHDIMYSDIVFMDSATPATILGLARCLAELPKNQQPYLFLMMQAGDVINPHTGTLKPRSVMYRYATEQASEFLDMNRVRFTAPNEAMVKICSQAANTNVELYPLPKCYDYDTSTAQEPLAGPDIVVSVVGHTKSLKGVNLLPGIVNYTRWCDESVRFSIQCFALDAEDFAYQKVVDKLSSLNGVDTTVGAVARDEYFRRLSGSDILLLPYLPEDYIYRCSGPFSEAVAMGIVTVVPQQSWMESIIKQGLAAGVIFKSQDEYSITEAILDARDDIDNLRIRAKRLAGPWQSLHSTRAYLEKMLTTSGDATESITEVSNL